MTANINFINGKAEAFTALTPAWWDHDSEYVADKYITSEEVWGERGILNFQYELCSIYDEYTDVIPGYKRTVRTDTGETIGVGMTEQYKIVQPREAFDWMDGLVSAGDMKYASAGVLNGGKQIWILGLIPGGEDCVDRHRKYILWVDDFTASKSLLWFPCFTRVECENTVNRAKGERGNFRGIVHKGDMDTKLRIARQAIQESEVAFKEYNDEIIKLAGSRYNVEQANEFVNTLLPETKDGRSASIRLRKIEALREGLRAACNQPHAGTFYQLYNCVTYAVDHRNMFSFRGQGDKRKTNRWISLMTGQGADFKAKALDLALRMCG